MSKRHKTPTEYTMRALRADITAFRQPGDVALRAVEDTLWTLTSWQLDCPARWWGDERGGFLRHFGDFQALSAVRLSLLEEDYLRSDDGWGPAGAYGAPGDEDYGAAREDLACLPAGTPVLEVDF